MLVRFKGSKSGAPDYLRTAKKAGRTNTRDELDERVVLFGDLDLTERILNSMKNEGMRSLNIVMSFRELDISVEKVREAVKMYMDILMAPYRPEEFNFYAEMHAPRIKTKVDVEDGGNVERRVHVHLLLPKLNLVTGKIIDPIGRGKNNKLYLDAIQEHVNATLGLESPKDYPRDGVGEARVIKRSRLDNFKGGKVKEFVARLKSELVASDIESYAEFKLMLQEIGDISIKNEGKENEYIGVKPDGETRFIYLRDREFRREYIDSQEFRNSQRAAVKSGPQVGVGKLSSDERNAVVREWVEVVAPRIKYINPGLRKKFKEFQESSREGKLNIIKDLESKYLDRYFGEMNHENERTEHKAAQVFRVANPAGNNAREMAGGIHAVPDLHTGVMDLHSNRPAVSLQSVRNGQLEQRQSDRDHKLRRAEAAWRARRLSSATGRAADSVTDQLLRDRYEQIEIREAAARNDIRVIKRDLDARRLLAELANTHGIVPSQFEIATVTGSGYRIRHVESTHNLNVGDFMTKYMRLAWTDAEEYLRRVFEQQMRAAPGNRAPLRPTRALYLEFASEVRPQIDDLRRQLGEVRLQRDKIKTNFYKRKQSIYSNYDIHWSLRKAQISVLQLMKVQEEAALEARTKALRERQRRLREDDLLEEYRDWLLRLAKEGYEDALHELRRLRIEPDTHRPGPDSFDDGCTDSTKPLNHALFRHDTLTFEIHRNGDVTYKRQGRAVMKDIGKAVCVLSKEGDNVEIALRLAMQKYGKEISINGSTAFAMQAIKLAALKNIDVTFSDPEHMRMLKEIREQLAQAGGASSGAGMKRSAFPAPRPRPRGH